MLPVKPAYLLALVNTPALAKQLLATGVFLAVFCLLTSSPLLAANQASQEKISLSYHHAPLRELLAELAALLEVNLVVSDLVTGELTLELNQVPVKEALASVLAAKGLASKQQGGVLLVAPAEEIARLAAEEQLAYLTQLASRPLEETLIKIKYAKAQEVQAFITQAPETSNGQLAANLNPANSTANLPLALPAKMQPGFLSLRGQVKVDERTNSLYVSDLPENLRRIKRLVSQLDVPVEQVLIETRIVVARAGVSSQLGVSWGLHSGSQGVAAGLEATKQVKQGVFEYQTALAAGRGASVGFQPNSGVHLGFVGRNLLLDLELAALESENRSEIISQPKVITSDRNKAVIRSGQEIPYSSTNADGERTTDFRQAELRLEVTPHLVGDGKIFLNLHVNNDSKGEETQNAGPTINTNAVETRVLVNNGETLVIGGIFTSEQLQAEVKFPFLGDLPLLGKLFSRSFHSQEKVELLVFVTPKLITTYN